MLNQQTESNRPTPRLRMWLADANMLAVAVIWGVNMPIMKFALGRMDEFLFNAVRLSLSAAVLALVVWWQRPQFISKSPLAPSPCRQWILIVIFSILTGFAYQVLFLVGIHRTSAGNTALIMASIPMWIAVLSFLFLRERLGWMAWVGLIAAMIGTSIVTLSRTAPSGSGVTLVGNLLVAAAALSWATGTVCSRPMMNAISPIALALCGVGLSLPLHFLIAWPVLDEFPLIFRDGWLVAALLFSGIFSTGLAYAMWNWGIVALGPSHAAVFQNLVPLFAIAAAWLLIGEVPYWLQLVGGGLILVGLVTMRRARRNGRST